MRIFSQVLELGVFPIAHVPVAGEAPVDAGTTLLDGVVVNGLALYPGDVVYVRSQGTEPLLVGLQRVWHETASPNNILLSGK